MLNSKMKKTIAVVVLVIACVVSSFAGVTFSKPEPYKAIVQSLDAKKTTATELMASATTASVLISALPDDTATPIAESLAEISQYFLIVLCALLLEKYLLTIIGFVTLRVLIPIACLLGVVYVLTLKASLGRIAAKIAIVSILALLAIPVSVKASDMIESTYQSSIDAAIDAAQEEWSAEESTETEDTTGTEETDQGFLSSILSGVRDSVSNAANTLTNAVQEKLALAEQKLNTLLESLAVMLVTTCLIPIAVILFFIWLGKAILKIGADDTHVGPHG